MIVSNSIKWLNEKHIEAQLKKLNLREVTSKYPSDLRKKRQELQESCTNQPCRRFLKVSLAKQIIMDCRTTPAVNFETKLGFNQYYQKSRQYFQLKYTFTT